MTRKTVTSTIIGIVLGLGLAMGAVVFAQNSGHMGNYQGNTMMGQTNQQPTTGNTYGTMHGQNQQTHHANAGKFAANAPCLTDTLTKSTPKVK